MSAAVLQPGFAEPVAGAQACFRAVLDAMARPGSLRNAGIDLTPPAPLAPATAAVLLTLLDYDTPVWLDHAMAAAGGWIGFHSGAPVVRSIAACSFAVAMVLPDLALPDLALPDLALPDRALPDRALPDLATLPVGSHEAPESAATLILQVAALGRGRRYRLTGPGLRTSALLSVDGLPAGFVRDWQTNHALFPRGIDIVLCAGTALAALPRSVALQEV